jgi:GGDEF domain-containing protein
LRIVAAVQGDGLRAVLVEAAAALDAELMTIGSGFEERSREHRVRDALRTHPEVLFIEGCDENVRMLRADTRARGSALVIACGTEEEAIKGVGLGADEWVLLPTTAAELTVRFRSALQRARTTDHPEVAARLAEHLQYEELLYDRFTGFPTLPVMLEAGREILERTGRLTILYIEFVRYSKLEEIYGWQKLDEVLQATANAVREFYDQQRGEEENLLMVSHTGDDDFIFFTDLRAAPEASEQRINEIADAMEHHIRGRIES